MNADVAERESGGDQGRYSLLVRGWGRTLEFMRARMVLGKKLRGGSEGIAYVEP